MDINGQIKKIVDKKKKLLAIRENINIMKKTRENMQAWTQKKIEQNIKDEGVWDTIWRWFK